MKFIHESGNDFCLLGPRGSGKSTIVKELAARLGYTQSAMETVVLYQDMNSRELLQQRRMLENGDTVVGCSMSHYGPSYFFIAHI